jgi:hypothetical protein
MLKKFVAVLITFVLVVGTDIDPAASKGDDHGSRQSMHIPRQSFEPEKALADLHLPSAVKLPPTTIPDSISRNLLRQKNGEWPILQSSAQIAEIVSWAENIYNSPHFYSVGPGLSFFVVTGSNWSGVAAEDVYIFMIQPHSQALPWKLIYVGLQSIKYHKPNQVVSGVYFAKEPQECVLIDQLGRPVLKLNMKKAISAVGNLTE